jgi:Domain of unknown function (DUF4062)
MVIAVQAQSRTLLIDIGSTAQELSEADFRDWMASQRVFISSVMDELREERRVVAGRIESLGGQPVWFETFGGMDDDPEAAYLNEVASSSIYVGILGRWYGKLLPSRYSATHTEYLSAEERGLRIGVWGKEVADREGHEEAFLQEIRAFHVTGRFSSAEELAAGVERRLRRIAAEDLAPWCKLGAAVFRASRVVEGGGRIAVRARVRGPDVLAELESMRPGQSSRGFEGPFIWAGRIRQVRVENIETTTTAGPGAGVELTLSVLGDPAPYSLHDVSLSEGGRTYSPADLTEIGLRVALLGESNPLGLSAHMATIENPFEQLTGVASEEIIRPVSHLLLTEALVGSGRAGRITRFRLGLPVRGRRAIQLEWESPRRYSNVEPERRRVEGVMS